MDLHLAQNTDLKHFLKKTFSPSRLGEGSLEGRKLESKNNWTDRHCFYKRIEAMLIPSPRYRLREAGRSHRIGWIMWEENKGISLTKFPKPYPALEMLRQWNSQGILTSYWSWRPQKDYNMINSMKIAGRVALPAKTLCMRMWDESAAMCNDN